MTIAEISEKTGLTNDTIRYYERIGLIPRINRNKSGIRDFTEEDYKWIDYIKCMRNAGIQIETLIEFVSLYQQGDETLETRKQLLIEQRNQLIEKMNEIKKSIERLDYKIDNYEKAVVERERKLSQSGTHK